MKKLIDELEAMARKLFRNPNANDDTCKGFDHALQIVRAHNPWHEVGELPESQDKEGQFISYLLRYKSFYWVVYHDGGYWYDESNDECVASVTDTKAHWDYLPEVKP